MANDEVMTVIRFLNASWTNKPLDATTASIWGSELALHAFDDVMRVLRVLLREQEWRPSLAQILKPLLKPEGKSVGDAFASVCEQIGKRPRRVTPLEEEAVRQLGGWSTLGMWQRDEWHWHFGRFKEIYRDLTERTRNEGLRAISPVEGRKALAGG